MLEDGDAGWKLVAPLSRLLGWALGLASAEMVTSLLTATLPPMVGLSRFCLRPVLINYWFYKLQTFIDATSRLICAKNRLISSKFYKLNLHYPNTMLYHAEASPVDIDRL